MKKVISGKIKTKTELCSGMALIEIFIGNHASSFRPGHFLTVLPPQNSGNFLRKPFSVASVTEDSVFLIIKDIGAVTHSLVSANAGTDIEILGPLGKFYIIPDDIETLWMIGGGTGIASLLFLNNARAGKGKTSDKVIWGGRSKDFLPSKELMENPLYSNIFKENIILVTDDGSIGKQGTSIAIVEEMLQKEQPDAIAACGPHGMLSAVKAVTDKYNLKAWFSLEEFMACGVGACAGCAVKSSQDEGYLKVCTHGPIFKSSEVIL